MNKNTYRGLRIATINGSTGVIVSESRWPLVRIALDGRETSSLIHVDKLFFPQHNQGYNQPCFQNL
jgi:hypothetical protein